VSAYLCDHGFGDADSLLLSARYTADEFVTDLRVHRVLDPEQLRHHPEEFLHVFFPRLALVSRILSRRLGLEGESQSILHLERRVMQVVFRVIQNLAPVLLAHFLRVGAAVRDVAGDLLVSESLVAEHLQERRTACRRGLHVS